MTEPAGWRELLRGGLYAPFALLILGVWLNAADTLVTATAMPSVARQIGGYAYFGWATAVFLLGAITAGASSGVLGARIGLRAAMTGAGLIYAVGCAASALSPDIGLFLVARLAQGLGAGWIVGLVFVAVGSVFPPAQWARAMAATTSVWGAATLLGPLVGGLFAAAGPAGWRGVFWFFAVQGVVFSGAAWRLLPPAPPKQNQAAPPWRQLAILALGVMAVASAGLVRSPPVALTLTFGGLALLIVMIRLDEAAAVAMLPRTTRDLTSAAGAGYLTIFLLEGATAGWGVYGAALVQTLYGVNPLVGGYVVGCVAVGWTLAALPIAGLKPRWQGPLIRVGASCVFLGMLGLTLATGAGAVMVGRGLRRRARSRVRLFLVVHGAAHSGKFAGSGARAWRRRYTYGADDRRGGGRGGGKRAGRRFGIGGWVEPRLGHPRRSLSVRRVLADGGFRLAGRQSPRERRANGCFLNSFAEDLRCTGRKRACLRDFAGIEAALARKRARNYGARDGNAACYLSVSRLSSAAQSNRTGLHEASPRAAVV